jgi:hypothetical protein
MKNLKLTAEQRRQRAKMTLFVTRLNAKDPRDYAKFLYQEFSESRVNGRWLIRNAIGRYLNDDPSSQTRHNNQRFFGKMIIALGEFILKGQPPPGLKKVNFDVAAMMHLPLHVTVSEIVIKLQKLHPDMTPLALERQVYRSLEACLKLGEKGIIKEP